ncbi:MULTISPECIES: CobD/CbiB family cobalamin biosynthesis protein [Corynebacterium]|uniref:CobD/CbiB family cobalamin biosynthesis protein n=1 Tax=Corynebacterium TaxID=1716 RepID=UPI00195D671C|nr:MULTISPECIES: CobD/CbiB family cobalamin biosynthesis protein [Corynebacterium]MDN8625128.1 CobD/CbiB family cobalamin biosynthesis protein [Corynebacterium kroppenstedtii]QRQ64879.1 cobalamin biosynthesis protein [Corynebacterium kroppenstedtii]
MSHARRSDSSCSSGSKFFHPQFLHLTPEQYGLVGGFLADAIVGDPASYHPVALFGRAAQALEERIYADSRPRGVAFEAVSIGIPVLATTALAGPRRTTRHAIVLGVVTFFSLGGTSLARTGGRVATALEQYQSGMTTIDEPRQWVPWLCSRDPNSLEADGIARAAVESLAENTSDASVGTLIWGALAGAPGVVAHRCINTLDAMVGYKSDRYMNFGWAAAKLDDLANWPIARVTALIHSAVGGRRSIKAWRKQNHPSPNAGVVESTAAGALGVQLGGATQYSYGVEMRPVMGEGPAPTIADVRRAVTLSRGVQYAALGIALLLVRCTDRR